MQLSILDNSRGTVAGTGAARRRARWSLYQITASLTASFLLAFIGYILFRGFDYYLTPFSSRAFHPLHDQLKPSGTIGRSFGIAGLAMMLLTFLYPLRKKIRFLQRIGTQSQWLQVHILLGLSGPALVVLHTTGKLAGIAAIGFYSMMAMVISGIFGRYLYAKIPRTKRGSEMNLREIEQRMLELGEDLASNGGDSEVLLTAVEEYLSRVRKIPRSLLLSLIAAIRDDLKAPLRFWQAWKITALLGGSLTLRFRTTRLILRQRRLLKQLAVLEACQRLFSYWHVFHRPFTILAFALIAFHIAVVTYLGYGVGR